MCELASMEKQTPSLKEWRAARGLTLDAAASLFNLSSKGALHDIEGGKQCSVTTALQIERVTGLPASIFSKDVALVEQARAA